MVGRLRKYKKYYIEFYFSHLNLFISIFAMIRIFFLGFCALKSIWWRPMENDLHYFLKFRFTPLHYDERSSLVQVGTQSKMTQSKKASTINVYEKHFSASDTVNNLHQCLKWNFIVGCRLCRRLQVQEHAWLLSFVHFLSYSSI